MNGEASLKIDRMIMKSKVLFVCTYNLRNPIAAGFLQNMAKNKVDISSAWVESDDLNPLVEEAMNEVGVNLSGLKPHTKKYLEINPKESFQYVVTICDSESLERCPVFPNAAKRLYWNMQNLKDLNGTHEEKLKVVRDIRDQIKKKVEHLAMEIAS
jgi:arsenate reductase (thioredoxin)